MGKNLFEISKKTEPAANKLYVRYNFSVGGNKIIFMLI